MLAPMLCAQYVILGACVVGAIIVSLCAAWGSAIVRGAIREREAVMRGTERVRREFVVLLDALRTARSRLSGSRRAP